MLPPLITNNLQAVVKRLNDLAYMIDSITGDNKTIRVSKPGGRCITIAGIARPPGASSSSAVEYLPFTVIQKNATTLTLLGYHLDEGRYFTNTVTFGLTEVTVAEQDLTIAKPGQVWLHAVFTGGYYVVTFESDGNMPDPVAGHWYFELGLVGFEGDKIKYYQHTYPGGQIHVAGRIV